MNGSGVATAGRMGVTLLGPFAVDLNGIPLDVSPWPKRSAHLFRLLAASPGTRRLREELLGIFWPDAPPETAASNLRYATFRLRVEIDDQNTPLVRSDRGWVSLNPAFDWTIDLRQFERDLETAGNDVTRLEAALQLYGGDPLPDDRYQDWAAPLRAHLQRAWQEGCRRLAGSLRDRDEPESALLWVERALSADPLDEATIQQELQLLILLGRRAEAMKRFRQFEQLLRSELDLEPSPHTFALLSRSSEAANGSTTTSEVHADRSAKAEIPGQVLPMGAYLGAVPSAPLVARREELSRVLSAVDAAGAGNGKLVLLAGEPGVGKTRLAQEASSALHERGFLVAPGRCYQPEQVVPYYPFLDILAALYRSSPPGTREDIPRRWPYLARLIPELQPTGTAAAAPITDLSGQDEPLLIRSVAGFLGEVALSRPLAILLDDLHWSDSASIKLLLHVARHAGGSRLFLLGTYRDLEVTYSHPLHQALIDLSREGLIEKVALERLDPAATGALIAGALGDGVLPPGLVEIVHRPTDGNPFFIQEVIRSMVEAGDLFQTDGRWERRPSSQLRVPESVRSVVGQRLSRLEADTQEVLFAASVLGQTFRFPEVERVSGRPEAQVETALDDATRAGLVREMRPDIYAFSHALAQHAVYAEMTGRKQRRLHLVAAETLEALPDHERRAAEIASHFSQAGNNGRAIPHAILAGDAARHLFAHTEAERHYRSAVEWSQAIDSPAQEALACEQLATTLLIQGRYPEAQECAQRAVSLFRSIDETEGEMRATNRLSEILQAQGSSREALVLVRALLDSLDEPAPSPGLALLYLRMGELEQARGEFDQTLAAAERAEEVARVLADQRLLVLAEIQRKVASWFLGQHAEESIEADAIATLDRFLRYAEEHDDPQILLFVLGVLGGASAFWGDLHASEQYRKRLVDVARRVGDRAGLARALSMLGAGRFLLGDWPGARAAMEEALDIARSIENADVAEVSLFDLGHLLVCEGDWDNGEAYLRQAVEMCERSGNVAYLRMIYVYLSNLDMLRGQPQAVIQRLTPLLDRTGYEESQVTPLLPLLAEAYLSLGDIERADALVTDALRRMREQGHRIDLGWALCVQAGVREQQDRLDEARAALDQALQVSREMSFPAAQADALSRRGTLETRTGDTEAARSYLLQARDIFQRLGARKDLERVDEALATMRPAG